MFILIDYAIAFGLAVTLAAMLYTVIEFIAWFHRNFLRHDER